MGSKRENENKHIKIPIKTLKTKDGWITKISVADYEKLWDF